MDHLWDGLQTPLSCQIGWLWPQPQFIATLTSLKHRKKEKQCKHSCSVTGLVFSPAQRESRLAVSGRCSATPGMVNQVQYSITAACTKTQNPTPNLHHFPCYARLSLTNWANGYLAGKAIFPWDSKRTTCMSAVLTVVLPSSGFGEHSKERYLNLHGTQTKS